MRLHHGADPRSETRFVKKIHFEPEVPAQVRAIPRHIAMTILAAIHRYAETGAGRVKPLSGEFEGFLRLRVGNHRVADRRQAYR